MRRLVAAALASVFALAALPTFAQLPPADPRPTASHEVQVAASRWLASLTPTQRSQALFAFQDTLRSIWAYTPRDRVGLSLKRMRADQRILAHALLRSLLSDVGYLKVNGIMSLEIYLQAVEQSGLPRDPEAYVIAMFGEPVDSAPWGFRFEGHHVSVNFTSMSPAAAATPLFLGSNPASVDRGPQTGYQVLGPEEALARALVSSLSDAQRRAAVISDSAPVDLLTSNARVASLEPAGLRMSDMSRDQRRALLALIEVYLGNVHPLLAGVQSARVHGIDPRAVTFAWSGGLGSGESHYYRVHAGSFLIEYDHTSNHVHTVWRDSEDDFGRDLLREHYSNVEHPRASSGRP